MKLRINSKIFENNPDLKVGVILIKGLNNTRRVSSVESLLRGICAQRGREFSKEDLWEHPMIKPWASAYGRFGANPQKTMPAIAALLKRVSSGDEIPHVNLLVDLYNYFSLKYLLPIGAEDLDWLCGDLELTYTNGKEAFRPIGSIDVKEAAEGEIAWMDKGGITSRCWNYRECERTKMTEKTTNAVLLIEDLSKMHLDKFGEVMRDVQNSVIRYIGGQIEPYILTEERREIDLGIDGRPTADDAKVPNQEKAHFIIEQAKKKPTKARTAPLPESKPLVLSTEGHYRDQLQKLVAKGLKEAFPAVEKQPEIEYPASSEHGDYASNIAFQLSKEVGMAPREIAEKIMGAIPQNELVDRMEIAGAGFINFFLTEKILKDEVAKVLEQKEKYGDSAIGKGRTIIVEYSAPNIAKPLGVHHLLTTIIGASLYWIFKKLGFEAVAINHIGDWGTQFGKLIYAYKQWGNREVVEQDPIPELLKLYIKFHDEAEKDASLEDHGRAEFQKFEEGDSENRELWQWFVDVSLKDIQKCYDRLGKIHFDEVMGESFYEDKLKGIIQLGRDKEVIEEGEEGALVIHFDDDNMPTTPVLKKDGSTLYITRDLAAIQYRVERWKPEKILYVVDMAQTLHFKQVFDAAKRMDICEDQPEHVIFGRMKMKDGKMSTRKGNIILMDDVIDEAEERAKTLNENPEVAHAVAIAAIKYNILSQNRNTDITFDWDRMLSFDGNSGPYLQYTYARARSILRRADQTSDNPHEDPENAEALIQALLRCFPKFQEVLTAAAQEYKPHILTNFLFDFAQKFNAFYNTVPVLKASEPARADRLRLVEASAQLIKNILDLLGIDVVEEM